jgi:hypothetical protein
VQTQKYRLGFVFLQVLYCRSDWGCTLSQITFEQHEQKKKAGQGASRFAMSRIRAFQKIRETGYSVCTVLLKCFSYCQIICIIVTLNKRCLNHYCLQSKRYIKWRERNDCAPMIYTARCVMLLMRAASIT